MIGRRNRRVDGSWVGADATINRVTTRGKQYVLTFSIWHTPVELPYLKSPSTSRPLRDSMKNIAWGVAIVGEFWGKPLDVFEGSVAIMKRGRICAPASVPKTDQTIYINNDYTIAIMISSPHMIMVANSCAGHADRYNILVWVFDVQDSPGASRQIPRVGLAPPHAFDIIF